MNGVDRDASPDLDDLPEDDDDDYTSLRPWWRLRRFQHPSVERAYQQWHHKLWVPRLRAMYVLSAIVYGGGFLLQLANPSSLKFMIMDMMPQCRQALLVTSAAARSCTFALAVFMLLPTHRCVTPRRFHPFVIGSYVVPLILEQSYVALDPCIYTGNRSVVSAATRADVDEWFADPGLQMLQAYWHAILYDFYFVCLGALSGLFPEWVLIVGCIALVLSQRQFAR